MKTKSSFFIRWILILGMAIGNVILVGPVEAAPTSTQPASLRLQTTSTGDEDFLIILPFKVPQPQEISPSSRPAPKHKYLSEIVYGQIKPIQAELERMQTEGWITGFDVRPELYGVVVHGLTQEGLQRLYTLPDIGNVLPKDRQSETCAEATAEALVRQVEVMSQSLRHRETMPVAGDLTAQTITPQTTNPSIEVEYYSNGYGYISGQTNPGIKVNLRVLRAGNVIATDSTTSSSLNGWYSFYPEWRSCPISGYTWTLQPGDMVEVTAGGRKVTTTVAPLVAWADPNTNQVSGKTEPGRTIKMYLWYYPETPCSEERVESTVRADSSGNFASPVGVDFDGLAYGYVVAQDSNGNGTTRNFYAYHLEVDTTENSFSGSIKPGVNFSLTLKRGENILETYTGVSDPDDGYFYGSLSQSFEPGDLLQLSGDGITLQSSIAPLSNLNLDSDADQIGGKTAAGYRIQGNFRQPFFYSEVVTGCERYDACTYSVSGSAGDFSLNPAKDVVRGDLIELRIIDTLGNSQFYSLRVPVIGIDISEPDNYRVLGAWSAANTLLTITHSDSSGNEKETIYANPDSWNKEFSVPLSDPLASGDVIRVSDGNTSLEMSVPSPLPTASLKNNLNRLTGSAPAGSHVLAELYDYQPAGDYFYVTCKEADMGPSTAFSLQFDNTKIGGNDFAKTWIRLPVSESLVRINRYAFTVLHWVGYRWVNFYYEPGQTIRAKWYRGSTLKGDEQTTLSNSWGAVTFNEPPLPGDRLEVTSNDGQSANLTVPNLTINLDPTNNRIYGKSVPNSPVVVDLQRWASGSYMYRQRVQANSGGDYSASFSNLYWWDCSPTRVDHRCATGRIIYYTPDGHAFYRGSPSPKPASEDSYEEDNDLGSAKPYSTVQTHTFHNEGDVDWVSFTVPEGDVNRVMYRIDTLNEGWDVNTIITLYDAVGNQILEEFGYGKGISWLPQAAGTYYVKISPSSQYSTAHCDAYYDLLILAIRAEVYLPLVRR